MELGYKVKDNQDMFSVSNLLLNGLDNIVFGLVKPSNKSLISTLTPLEVLTYDDSYEIVNIIQIGLNEVKASTQYKVEGLENQSTFDVCLMNYGNLDNLFKMISDNTNIVSVTDIDAAYKTFTLDSNKVNNNYIKNTIVKKGYSFGTIDKKNIKAWILDFGYWDDLRLWIDVKTWID